MAETASMTPDRVVRVLVIDDDEDDFFLARDLLEEITGTRFLVDWEADWKKALDSICRGEHDVYLVDYRLGARSGLDLIRESNRRNCSAPLILLTGQGERALDFAAMQAGAADYLEKGKLDSTLLERSIRYSIQNKQSEEQLEKARPRTHGGIGRDQLSSGTRNPRAACAWRKRCGRSIVAKTSSWPRLAHELRNPLAPIRNALEIMRLGADNPRRSSAAEP